MSLKITSTTSESINSQDIQNVYMKFYTFMMQYLWNLDVVKNLANLEIAVFKRFPDKEEMEKTVNALEIQIKDTMKDEENPENKGFLESFETLKEYIQEYTDNGYEIYNLQPAVNVEEILDESEDDGKLHVGKIVKKEVEE